MAVSVSDRLAEFGPAVDARLRPKFAQAGISYPPPALTLVGLKRERTLEIYAPGKDGKPRFVARYPILAASGHPGPKLREGDWQVPEGFYRIELLNPNSRFHLSLRVNYPNASDRTRAAEDGRDLAKLGGDIMIHGSNVSVGCLAMGDPAAEDLFILAARTGLEKIRVLLCPMDFRIESEVPKPPASAPAWTMDLWKELATALKKLPRMEP